MLEAEVLKRKSYAEERTPRKKKRDNENVRSKSVKKKIILGGKNAEKKEKGKRKILEKEVFEWK